MTSSCQVISLWAAAGILVLLLGWRIWRLFRPLPSRLDQPGVFFALIFLAMLVLRLPQITWPQEINVDESQLLAQGMRYLSHPVPWRDVDGTTGGPLDSLLLSVPILCGAPASWVTSRTVLWAAQCATVFFIYLALRCFATRAAAQAVLLPTIFFYAFAMDADFTHYSSETLSVVLLSVMVWLLCRAWMQGKFSSASLFFTGFLAGCIPFAKLQAGPLAAYLFAAGLAQTIVSHRKNAGRAGNFWKQAGLMCLGAACIPALLLGLVVVCGAWNDFWISYILAPAAYTNETLSVKMDALWTLFTYDTNFRSYLASALAAGMLLATAWSWVSKPSLGYKLFTALTAILGLGIVAIGCMLVAGKGYGHYLLLLIPAQAMFFGLMFTAGRTLLLAPDEVGTGSAAKPPVWFLAGFAVILCFQVGKAPAYVHSLSDFVRHPAPNRKSFIARRVLQASRPGDTMSVWGWVPSYYLETGRMPATRDAIGHFVIYAGPYLDYYRHRYLNDLKQNKPAVFIDAMADGLYTWAWHPDQRHECFPELTKFVDENYSLWLSVHIEARNAKGIPVRIYIRKDRMEELHLKPEELSIPTDSSLAPD